MTERITDERLASLFKDAEQCGIFPAVKVNPRELSSVLAELAEFRDREAGNTVERSVRVLEDMSRQEIQRTVGPWVEVTDDE